MGIFLKFWPNKRFMFQETSPSQRGAIQSLLGFRFSVMGISRLYRTNFHINVYLNAPTDMSNQYQNNKLSQHRVGNWAQQWVGR